MRRAIIRRHRLVGFGAAHAALQIGAVPRDLACFFLLRAARATGLFFGAGGKDSGFQVRNRRLAAHGIHIGKFGISLRDQPIHRSVGRFIAQVCPALALCAAVGFGIAFNSGQFGEQFCFVFYRQASFAKCEGHAGLQLPARQVTKRQQVARCQLTRPRW